MAGKVPGQRWDLLPWAPRDWFGEANMEAKSLIEGVMLGAGGWRRDLEFMYSFTWTFAQAIFPETSSEIPANGRGVRCDPALRRPHSEGHRQINRPDDFVGRKGRAGGRQGRGPELAWEGFLGKLLLEGQERRAAFQQREQQGTQHRYTVGTQYLWNKSVSGV